MQMEVRMSNLTAAKGELDFEQRVFHRTERVRFLAAVADVVRTSLGPRGMDKMIKTPDGQVLVTNDGATILKNIGAMHPAARMVCRPSAFSRSSRRA